MKYVSYADKLSDLNVLKNAGVEEVILSSKELSRFQKNSHVVLIELLTRAKSLGLKTVLEWDILITEQDFESIKDTFLTIPSKLYDVIRVQDLGVLEYCLEETTKPVQLILENGNHNLKAIETWVDYIGERLDRVALSNELNKTTLEEYIQKLNCPVEILTLGRILLFYTPRKLLSALVDENDIKTYNEQLTSDYIEAQGESEESPHKGFPLVENRHGTFMFHIKDLFLLDKFEELKSIGLDYARVDLRFNDIRLIDQIVSLGANDEAAKIKESYGVDVIRGYFQTNKSDVLFKKLKNYRIQRVDESYVGEVLEAQKSKFMAIHIKSQAKLTKDSQLRFVTPEGKEHFCKVHTLKDSNHKNIEMASQGQLALINYMSGVWTKSQVYLN